MRFSLRASVVLLAPGAALVDTDLFVGGTQGYSCFRLPNLVQLPTPGSLLAIAQGHFYDCSDGGRLDIVARRSSDNGNTWDPMTLVHTESNEDANVTLGTPTLVADKGTGVVHLFICRDFATVLLMNTTDGGEFLQTGLPSTLVCHKEYSFEAADSSSVQIME